MKVDTTTLSVYRGKFTTVCGQINLKKPLVPYISLLVYLQKVEDMVYVLSTVDMGTGKTIVLK